MGKKRISAQEGESALANLPDQLPTAVRYLLQEIEIRHPGGTVELRVPPYGAVQCISGMDHRRGTPPNVVEITPELFIDLVLKRISFDSVPTGSGLTLSGVRAGEIAQVF
jgi:Bacterial SCP ortholog